MHYRGGLALSLGRFRDKGSEHNRLVITFLPRSKSLLISWLQLPSAVILEPPKIKSDTQNQRSVNFNHTYKIPSVQHLIVFELIIVL